MEKFLHFAAVVHKLKILTQLRRERIKCNSALIIVSFTKMRRGM